MLQDEDFDSDTSDEDFVPEGVESDDEPLSGVEEEADETENEGEGSLAKKSTKNKNNNKKRRRPGSVFAQKPDNKEPEVEQGKELKSLNEEQNRKKTDNLWADFLAGVEEEPSPPLMTKSLSWAALLGNKKSPSSSNKITSKQEPSLNQSEVKKKDVPVNKPSKVKITQVFEFAGEEVRVEKEVDADSAEAKEALTSPESSTANDSKSDSPGSGGTKRLGGLSSIVGLLDNKKQKLTTLEKTKLDWSSFKCEEGLNEELEKHKKSKDGYLDKKAFLERADVRQFEIERAMRMNKRSSHR